MFRQWLDKYYQSISEDEWQQIEEDGDAFDYAHCGPGISVDTMEGLEEARVHYSDHMHEWLKSVFKIQRYLFYTLPDQPSSKLYIIPYIFSCIPVIFFNERINHYIYEKSTSNILHRAIII